MGNDIKDVKDKSY